ncbi:uncharacterized protein LOC114535954 [Dendronephthya gigantea]|uniref:uncharacterized protein LOC114535954 n=1 Tax=Dendronephthya gigantea TaxID=151771 RepID=UPI00106CD7DF|nr:uncharacterized protein LOC114535954 [Dendronephthya gigantea]XP_028413104.1 uncharacterized protein LOC114535954 [Dendronephthya gigantea]
MVFLCSRALTLIPILLTTPLPSMINAQLSTTNFLKAIDEPIANFLNARDFGVLGDGITDDSRAIQTFVNNASLHRKIAFFPSGEYIISQNIWIDGSVSIQGSSRGITVLKTPRTKILQIYFGNKRHGLRDLSITHIFFDGITLYFSSKRFKHNFRLANCLFFTSRQPLLPIKKKASIVWQRVANGIISNVVILRSKATHAVGVSFYKTKYVRVESCIFGLNFNNLTWLTTQYQGINTWTSLIEKLHFTKGHYRITSDQGRFQAALYGNRDDNLTIKLNIFNGSPYKSGFIDHVIYLKGFDGLYVLGNYARGWPSTAAGGFKMRNGENLVVARNYLVDTGILLYTHKEINFDPLHQGLSNVYIYGNHLVELTNIGKWGTGISYYEPHWFGDDTNVNFCRNTFEISNLNLTSPPIGIHISNGDKEEHHVFKDNVYFGTKIPVKLFAMDDTEYEDGTCDQRMVSRYQGILIPNLVIPPYCNRKTFLADCSL